MAFRSFYKSTLQLFSFVLLSVFLFNCGGGEKKDSEVEDVKTDKIEVDSSKSSDIINVGGQLFSIPSPIQTAYLIEESGAGFNGELMNDPEKAPNYTSKFQKALNLGVYGADLGYVTIYDNSQNALSYLNAVQQLSDELGVGGAFSKDLIKRFSDNLGNEDSMLVIVSDAYQAGDAYLKNNDRNDVAGLILAGGWVEATYFATDVAMKSDKEKVKNRVAQQKTSLNNLIQLLSRYRNKEDVNDLVEDLEDLYKEFKNIKYEYVYKKPEVKPEEKMTILKSETKVTLKPEHLKAISKKVKKIRNQIVG